MKRSTGVLLSALGAVLVMIVTFFVFVATVI